ncbi:hypothetical protein FLX56_25335 [Synechococcus moorigangaii CMS01]|nr:hypothetical protein [Synechococcus moorigangaii CMS01]
MNTALHIKTKVLPGHRIEIQTEDLHIGDSVDVFLIVNKSESEDKIYSISEILEGLPSNSIFKNAEEIDAYIREERNSWDD